MRPNSQSTQSHEEPILTADTTSHPRRLSYTWDKEGIRKFPTTTGINKQSKYPFRMSKIYQLLNNAFELTGDTISIKSSALSLPEKGVLHLKVIRSADKSIEMKAGLYLEVEFSIENGKHIAYNDHFGIYGLGDTREAARRDFEESFVEFYENVVDTPQESLGESAVKFRRTLTIFADLKSNA